MSKKIYIGDAEIAGGDGKSAYQSWLDQGNVGTEQDFLDTFISERSYDSSSPNGMGYVILKKNKSFASQVTAANTIYEIRYAFDLDGASVTIPVGCVLKFVGGVLSNGTLTGSGTIIDAKEDVIFQSGISVIGTWLVSNIHAVWFGDITASNRINQLFKLCSNSIHNNVFIPDVGTDYIVAISNDVVHDDAIVLQDLTGIDIYLDGTIKLNGNNVPDYDIIRIYGCKDIFIKGSGVVQGDRAGHDYTTHSGDGYATHEWGRGIHVIKSQSVSVEGISVRETTGDGINCNYGFSDNNDDVEYTSHLTFRNINVYGCRRNGFTIGSANNILIENYKCEFTSMSGSAANTDPVAGIDIEPDPNLNAIARDIVLNNIHVKGAKRCIDIIGINAETHDVSISNLFCENTTDALVHLHYCNSVSIKNVHSKATARCQYLLQGNYSSNIHVENVVADHQFLIIFNISDGVWNLSNINLKHATNSGTLFTSNIIGDMDVFIDGARATCGRLFSAATGTYQQGNFVFKGCTLSTGATPEVLNGTGVVLINTTITGLYGGIQLNGATIINSRVKFNATSQKVDVAGAVFANFNQFVADSVTYPSTQITGVPTKGTMYVDQGALKWSDGSAWTSIQ